MTCLLYGSQDFIQPRMLDEFYVLIYMFYLLLKINLGAPERKERKGFGKNSSERYGKFSENIRKGKERVRKEFWFRLFPNSMWTLLPISFRMSLHLILSERFRIFSEVSHYVGSDFFPNILVDLTLSNLIKNFKLTIK